MPGVYISYPFCSQKCTFCNFASGVSGPSHIAAYEKALADEIRTHAWAWSPETIYWGGGTPSLMSADVFRDLSAALPQDKIREATIEAAPGTINPEAIPTWRNCGINRVSLGVQSFCTDELRQTGRRHTAETVEADVALLRSKGIENINIDLIAGLPGQTLASFTQSLDWIERLAPPHVSVYIFEIDEESRLGKEIVLGGHRFGANRVPTDDETAALFELAVSRLRGLGFHHYEISNFAKPGFESLHNLKYWQLEPYVGFGLDAHSYNGRERWSNPDALDSYLTNRVETREPTDRGEERFFVGLRLLDGVEPTTEDWARFHVPIAKFLNQGLLERDGSKLKLTPPAVLLSNEIFQEFLNV